MKFYTESGRALAMQDIHHCIEVVEESTISPFLKEKIRYYLLNYAREIETESLIGE